MTFNGSSATNGRWIFPQRYHSFTTAVPGGGDTLEVIMLDTESLIGGLNTPPATPVPLYYPPPMESRKLRRSLRQSDAAVPLVPVDMPAAAAAPAAAVTAAAPTAVAPAPAVTVPTAMPAAVPAPVADAVPAAAAPVAAVAAAATPAWSAPAVGGAVGGATPFVWTMPTAWTQPSSPPPAAAAQSAMYGGEPVITAAELSPAAQAAAQASMDAFYDSAPPPPVDEAQWNWLEGQLNSSTADWIIVVGYHPIWSAGSWGPTWPLVERLAPKLEAAGVALYISGLDHLMQHFNPVPIYTNLDFVGVGNGAYAQPEGATAAIAMPHALDCPDKSLQFSFGATAGFVSLQISSATPKQPSELHVNFYDANQTMLYNFFKENPRTMPGKTAGDLKAPPAPGHGAAAGTYNAEPLILMGGGFLVVAVLLCLIGAATHARKQLMYLAALRASKARAQQSARAPQADDERTPLMLGARGSRAEAQKPPPLARRYVGT